MTVKRTRTINVATDFSKYPAGRYPEDGDDNGTRFREEFLAVALRDTSFDEVCIIFDGVAGFGSSFLEEAFGGLIRELGMEKSHLDSKLKVMTTEVDLEDYVSLAYRYVEQADKALKE